MRTGAVVPYLAGPPPAARRPPNWPNSLSGCRHAWRVKHSGIFRAAPDSWAVAGPSRCPPVNAGGAQNYGNAFLPASFQATHIGEQGSSVANAKISNISPALSSSAQRRQLDLLNEMNQDLIARNQVDPAVEGVINSFELGFRMQSALPATLDITRESAKTLEMYGIIKNPAGGGGGKRAAGGGNTDNFGRQCLMARRLIEAGVRFVELGHGGWDTHGGLKARLTSLC